MSGEYFNEDVVKAHFLKLSKVFENMTREKGYIFVPPKKKTWARIFGNGATLGGINVKHITVAFITTDEELQKKVFDYFYEYLSKEKDYIEMDFRKKTY